MTRVIRALAGLLATIMVVGCTVSSPDSSRSGAGVTPEQYQQGFIEAWCVRSFACCTQHEVGPLNMFDDAAECTSVMTKWHSWIAPGVAAGRLKYDATAAKKCIELLNGGCAWADQTFRVDGKLPAPCAEAIIGQVGLDETCHSDVECVSGVCFGASPALGATTGTCKAMPDKEGTCLRFQSPRFGKVYCPEGTECFATGKCEIIERAKAGGSCGGTLQRCAFGLRCDAESTCVPAVKKAGEPCSENSECTSQLCIQDAKSNKVCTSTPICAGG